MYIYICIYTFTCIYIYKHIMYMYMYMYIHIDDHPLCIAVPHASCWKNALSFPGGRWIATPKCPGDAVNLWQYHPKLLEKL